MVDALASGASVCKDVKVQILSRVPKRQSQNVRAEKAHSPMGFFLFQWTKVILLVN